MIRIAVCDDDADDVLKNKNILEKCLAQEKAVAEICAYASGEMLTCDILDDHQYFDLILLDIEMPGISGMEIVQRIKSELSEVRVIFITSHVQYAIDSFELNIFRYVPKADLEKRLPYAVSDALKLILLEDSKYYTVQTANRMEKVSFRNILYIQREGKNAVITTFHGTILVRKSLLTVYEELNAEEFLFIERGCIVNLIHISQIKNSSVRLNNGTTLSISRSHLQEVKLAVNSYWGEHI